MIQPPLSHQIEPISIDASYKRVAGYETGPRSLVEGPIGLEIYVVRTQHLCLNG